MDETIYKLPREFLARIKILYPDKYQKICSTFLKKKITAFRINYLKTDIHSLRKELVNTRVKFQELTFPKGSFLLKSELRMLQKTELYLQGKIFVQNVSSMLVPLVLSPVGKDLICDLCSAPGSKTSQISSLAPESTIMAIEKNRGRYYKLLANLKQQGVENVKAFVLDGIWIRKKFPETFDKILVDAPCSAEGLFNVNNPRSYSYWKPRKIKEAVSKQKQLLNAAFYALKEGGEIVYSTCTFAPEENEVMLDWFVNKFKDKLEVLPIHLPLSNAIEGKRLWKGKKLIPEVKLSRRVIPNEYMEAFFIAKIKKISD